jgi:hypothetical protein
VKTIAKIARQLRATAALRGKPPFRQLAEALVLRLGARRIGLSEYFDYGIWRESVTPAQRDEFIGWRQSAALDRRLNRDWSRVLANDKLMNYLVLRTLGYPIPEPIATYTRQGRQIGTERRLRTLDEVADFLRSNAYPLYVKPVNGGYGRGVLGIAARTGDHLHLLDGSIVRVGDFLVSCDHPPYGGMLFQQPLQSHPAISALTGSTALSCVRIICLLTPREPVIHTAFWKLTSGNNMLDNFSHGDYGNCLAAVNLDDGLITRAIKSMGPGGAVTTHPTTHKPIIGFRLPDWDRAKSLVRSAAVHFAGLRLQNWDVALSPHGPVLVELNTESELAVPQAISGNGMMDTRLRRLLSEIADDDDRHLKAVHRQ